MLVYRLSNKKYGMDISERGAAITGGRWNKKGRPVLYTSESISLPHIDGTPESIVRVASS